MTDDSSSTIRLPRRLRRTFSERYIAKKANSSEFALMSVFGKRSLFKQSLVISHDEMAINFLHEIESDADSNQQSGSTVEAGDHVVDA